MMAYRPTSASSENAWIIRSHPSRLGLWFRPTHIRRVGKFSRTKEVKARQE